MIRPGAVIVVEFEDIGTGTIVGFRTLPGTIGQYVALINRLQLSA